MLKYKIREEADAIEKNFCIPFKALTQQPMNRETSGIMVSLLFSGDKENVIPDEEKPFIFKLMEKRLEHTFNYTINEKGLLFLTYLCESPGIAVMYLTYLQYEAKQRGLEEITLDTICKIFPMGFPSKDDLHTVWEGQKLIREREDYGSDNLLDHPSALQSIFN